MTTISQSIWINAPVAAVFSFLADWRNLPRFNRSLLEVHPIGEIERGNGARFGYTQKVALAKLSFQAEFSDFIEDRGFIISAYRGPKAIEQYQIDLEDNGARLRYSLEYEMPLSAGGGLIDSLGAHQKRVKDIDCYLSRLKCLLECSDCPQNMCDE